MATPPLNNSQLVGSFPDNTVGQITPQNMRDLVNSVLLIVNNLSDILDAAAARANLGLGSAATADSGAFDAAGAAAAVSAAALKIANNLSDLADAGAARANLGLGTAAIHASGDFDSSGAASAAAASSLQKSSNLADLDSAAAARTNLGVYSTGQVDTAIGNISSGGAPAGSTGAVQINDAGAFGDSGWSVSGGRLIAPGLTDDGVNLLQLGSNFKLGFDGSNDPTIYFAYSHIAEYYPQILTLYGQGGVSLGSYGILASSHSRTVFMGVSDDIAGAQSADDGSTPWQYVLPDAATNTSTVAESIYHSSTGTPGIGFGVTQLYYLDSSTNTKRLAADVTASWSDATDASYAGAYEICVYTWYGGRTVGLLIQGDSVAEGRGPTVQTQNVVLDDGAGNLSANGFLLGTRLTISGALSDGTYSCGTSGGSITITNGVITAIS